MHPGLPGQDAYVPRVHTSAGHLVGERQVQRRAHGLESAGVVGLVLGSGQEHQAVGSGGMHVDAMQALQAS